MKKESVLFGFVAILFTVMSLGLVAVPNFIGTFAVKGVAVTSDDVLGSPLKDVKFEIRKIDKQSVKNVSAPQLSSKLIALAISNESGEFKFEDLSFRESYLITPISSKVIFKPAAIALDGKEVAALLPRNAVLQGFVFEAR